MPIRIGEEELPTIDELETLPKTPRREDPSDYMDALFEDGQDIYDEKKES